jgi:hypothetical protein
MREVAVAGCMSILSFQHHAPAQLRRGNYSKLRPIRFTRKEVSLKYHSRFGTSRHKMDEYTQARCCAAENAALLFCLKEQPDIPRDSAHATDDSNNPLSLSREMQLVEYFAFISSTKDDPNRVTAVCMEADQDRAGVTFRVAANTDCLSHIQRQLQAVANIMMRASKHGMFWEALDKGALR